MNLKTLDRTTKIFISRLILQILQNGHTLLLREST
nr:MAG TPA: hypothetical protein [Caudoviricetes sp.]